MGSLLTAYIERKVPKDTNGVFFLRIEDTDQKRSVENGIQGIIDDLKNFDIMVDEGVISEDKEIGNYGPYIQSKRIDIYRYSPIAYGTGFALWLSWEGGCCNT
jgi:glutamyl-tRNA synthetase